MAHKLNTLYVQGFKSIKHLELELTDLTVLIGANGAGKSNLIDLFKFLREIVAERLQLYTAIQGGAKAILYDGNKISPKLYVRFDFAPYAYEFLLIPSRSGSLVYSNEHVYHFPKEGPSYIANICKSMIEGMLGDLAKYGLKKSPVPKEIYDTIDNWRVYHLNTAGVDAKIKKHVSRLDYDFLREDGSNLAAFLYVMKKRDPRHYEHVVKVIELIIPCFGEFVFRPDFYLEGELLLEWKHPDTETIFNASDLSDGSLRFICLAALLINPRLSGVILIEEPERGLNPATLHMLGALIRSASSRAQVIISTQSVSLLNKFKPENIVVVEQDKEGSSFKRLDPEQLTGYLENNTIGELWEMNGLGGQ